jgi:hypothetical protein
MNNSNKQQKVYILLKDLPDGSIKGDEYAKYGDRYRNERFMKGKSPVIEDASWFTWQVENNPEWFKEKQQPIVEDRIVVTNIQPTKGSNELKVYISGEVDNIPDDKYQIIMNAIAWVLNDEKIIESIPTIERQDSKEEQKPIPFEKELEQLINKYSMENGSDTPDYILAKYLSNCLEVFNDAVTSRDISKN